MTTDTAAGLVNELLSKEWLISNEEAVARYLVAIAKKLKVADGHTFAEKCIAGYFMKYYLDNRTELKFSFEHRLSVFRIQAEAYKVLADRKAEVEGHIKQFADAFVDFLINAKEDSEVMVPQLFGDFFNNYCKAEWFDNVFENQISKLSTAAQASFFGSLQNVSEAQKTQLTTQFSKQL